MLACIHKVRRSRQTVKKIVGRLPNPSDMMMTLMFAANRTITESTNVSTPTSLQITMMEFYNLACVFVCGYRYKKYEHGFDVRCH